MNQNLKHLLQILILSLFLGACSLPAGIPGILTVTPPLPPAPTVTPTEALCGFVEGRQQLPEVSASLLEKLKNADPRVKSALAEAYGENCIAEDGSLVRFAARETDFYVTFKVENLQDEAALAGLLEEALSVIAEFPVGQTPGPNPGYIGISFEAGSNVQNMWFLREKALELQSRGIKGIELYQALNTNP